MKKPRLAGAFRFSGAVDRPAGRSYIGGMNQHAPVAIDEIIEKFALLD